MRDMKKNSNLYDVSNIRNSYKIGSHIFWKLEEILEIIHFNIHVLWIRTLKFREDKVSIPGDMKF